ncbi:MAG: ribbon-helix-helix domain-containing protein [Methylocella sp.]
MAKPANAWSRAVAAVKQLRDGLVTRRVWAGAHRTSCRFDALTWRALHDIAAREWVSVQELCGAINSAKQRPLTFSTAIRIAVLQYYYDAATEPGHQKAVHGASPP